MIKVSIAHRFLGAFANLSPIEAALSLRPPALLRSRSYPARCNAAATCSRTARPTEPPSKAKTDYRDIYELLMAVSPHNLAKARRHIRPCPRSVPIVIRRGIWQTLSDGKCRTA